MQPNHSPSVLQRAFIVALIAGSLLALPQVIITSHASPVSCPASLNAQLNGLNRWHLAAGLNYRSDFASQIKRFSPSLYNDLHRGFALQPSAIGFVDFDPFSNTQT